MDGWIRKETETVTQVTERNGVVLLTFPALERLGMVRAGFSTRHGGVSTGHLAEMNLIAPQFRSRARILRAKFYSIFYTFLD